MRRHFFWIIELFVWLLILFSIAGCIMFAKYNYKKSLNTYQIFLPDVDGLIIGSPVKFMGIQIGYVNQIDIVGDDVYVKFIITSPNVKIPHGSIVTVEFSGLGGSKSLEIYPPQSNKNLTNKILIAQNPKRIHDSLGLLNDMIEKVINITYSVSRFMNKVMLIQKEQQIKTPNNSKSINDLLDSSNKWLDKTNKQSDNLNKKIKKVQDGRKNGSNCGQHE